MLQQQNSVPKIINKETQNIILRATGIIPERVVRQRI